MKAIIQTEYGLPEVLQLQEVPDPASQPNEVVVRVKASSVNALDWHLMTGTPYLVRPTSGFRRPKNQILGADIAGIVEEAGSEVTSLKAGDEVFGDVGHGGYAQLVAVPENKLVKKPAGVSFEDAASIPVAGLTALQGLRDTAGLKNGQSVLINGASGGVGSFSVSIAKALGADVTAVCSTANIAEALSNGADHVVDYTNEDFTETDQRFDVVFDIPGNRALADCKRILKPGGVYVMVGGPKRRWVGPIYRLILGKLRFMRGDKRMGWFVANMNQPDMDLLGEYLASGQVKPVIEATYTLGDVPEAVRRFGRGHARGKTVIAA